MPEAKQKLAIVAPTLAGCRLGVLLAAGLPEAEVWTKTGHAANETARTYEGSLGELVAKLWPQCDRLVFILTVGAIVRAIAPFLREKATDPGVVAVDEAGQTVVSLSGGHLGGADRLAAEVAALLGVAPIVTSVARQQNLPAVDLLGQPYGWRRGDGDWTGVASAIARRDEIVVVQTCGSQLWRALLPGDRQFCFEAIATPRASLWISERVPPSERLAPCPTVAWHPRVLWVGIGCERGTTLACLEAALLEAFARENLAPAAIAGLASIDIKADETGLCELARKHDWPLVFFSAETLARQAVPTPSAVVAREVGTPSVAEAAAIAAAGAEGLLVSKQIYRDGGGACTVAVAQARQEYNPRAGQLYLIGSGPGALGQLTLAARAALARCDAIVGYQLYLDLLAPLFEPQQVILRSPIGEEVQRAERAIALARQGLTVGVVSSGDCGIYGMAGLVLECLARAGWDGKTPGVEVLPGISALQAVAARVGAPLMHDFCAISLSDLLVPWALIEKRLRAAADADFATALYNPRSRQRQRGIEIALEIFRQARSPETPVVIARSVYRQGEDIRLLTLAEVDPTTIDMLSVVLIGNAKTFTHAGWAIAPRGYLADVSST